MSSSDFVTDKIQSNLKDAELLSIDPSCYPSFYENLRLTSLDGNTLELDSLSNKTIFLNFWLTSCIPCLAEMKSIEKLYSQFGNSNIQFLVISHEDPDVIKEFLQKHEYNLPIYTVEKEMLMSSIYTSKTVPATFLISKERTLIKKEDRAVNWYSNSVIEYFKNSLE